MTWLLRPGGSIYDALAEQCSELADRVAAQLQAAQCVCLVNHIVSAPSGGLGLDAEVIHFYLLRNGESSADCATVVTSSAAASEPLPPHPASCPVSFGPTAHPPPCRSAIDTALEVAQSAGPAASSTASAPHFSLSEARVPVAEGRYTVIGSIEGAINKPRAVHWDGPQCLADALATAPRRGPYLHGRVLMFPLPELYVPQVLLSRADAMLGWITVAADLRPLRLGVKAIDVRIGSTVDQLFSPGSSLFEALDELGRLRQPLRFRINSGVAFRASAFCLATETLTVEAAAWPAGSAVADSGVLPPAIGAAGSFPAWSAISSEPVATDDLIEMAEAFHVGPPPWQLPVTSATIPVAQVGHSSADVPMPNASVESQAASGPDSCSEPSPQAVLSRLLAEAADPPTTTSTTDVLHGPHLGCSTTTTSTSSLLPPPVTIACAVPGDQPRCVRLQPGEHISQALWSILQDPGRVLPAESTWTLATCPRTFPDRIAGRLVLATLATTHPFRCNVWLDIRSEPPQLFTVGTVPPIRRSCSSSALVAMTYGCSWMALLPAIRQRCAMVACSLSAFAGLSALPNHFRGSFHTTLPCGCCSLLFACPPAFWT